MPEAAAVPLIVPFFISHRGCPNQCVFCDQRAIAGSDGSFPSADELRTTIATYAAARPGHSVEVAFYGGSFTCLDREDQLRLLSPLQPLLADGTVSSIRLSTRPDAITAAGVSLLRDLGVRTIELGVQAMDDHVLMQADRGHTVADVIQAVAVLRESGVAVGVQLMPGLPGDDPVRSLASLDGVLGLRPDFLRIYPTLVLAGTPLAARFAAGFYQPMTLRDAVSRCKIMLCRTLQAQVPVIRMGLQPTADLSAAGVVIAGPYHPAFRQLVESELCYDLLVTLLGTCPDRDHAITVTCAPGRVSDVIGQKRANCSRLLQEHGVRVAAVQPDPRMSVHELLVVGSAGACSGTILKDLHY